MKKWVPLSCMKVALVFVTVLCGLWHSEVAEAVVGRTPGNSTVTRSGAFVYNIPIWAPPGPRSLQPNIALSYDSQSPNGYLGVGWGLSGLSSIYRCNHSFAQDGIGGAVTLTASDVFCLDGQRLRLTSGTYGVAGSTYQTEIANFELVTAYGAAGNGPAYFTVQDRNGRTFTYGNGGNSLVSNASSGTALSWQLNEVSDPAGNTMTISYNTANGAAVPNTISWTPTAAGSTSYSYTMVFAYGTNVAPPSGYVAGNPVNNSNLLSSITINYSGTTAKKYVLSYQASGTTGRDLLTQVEECADSAATNCLAPTTFSYQTGGDGVTTTVTTAIASGTQFGLQSQYDFNGDGYHDLVYCNGGVSGTIDVEFGSASGYGTPVATGIACGALYGDLLGNGQDGLLVNNSGTWYYYTWNGSTFAGVSTGLAVDAAGFALADVNGDGLPDLVSGVQDTVPGPFSLYIRLNTTTPGGTLSFASSTTLAYSDSATDVEAFTFQASEQYGGLRGFDFNGDGMQDIVLQVLTHVTTCKIACPTDLTVTELLSTGTAFSAAGSLSVTTVNQGFGTPYFLKYNSDACTDMVFGTTIYISGCDGTLPSSINLAGEGLVPVGVMDWNGDGLDDVICQNGSTFYIYTSSGTGGGQTSIPYSSSNQYFGFDANGDGLSDLGVAVGAATAGSNSTSFEYYLHTDSGQPPDLESNVTDGYGNSVSPTYLSIVQGAGSYYFLQTAPQYPYAAYLGPLYVVNTETFSDPSSATGGTYSKSHYYAGAQMNLQGRGFAGFHSHQIQDSRNDVYETFEYNLAFPYTGMQVLDYKTENNLSSENIGEAYNSLACIVLSESATCASPTGPTSQRYFPYVSGATTLSYELGTAASPATRLVRTAMTSYTYDDFGNALTIATTVTDNDSGSPYYSDTWTTTVTNTPVVNTSTWCLNLLTQSQVAYTSSVGSAVPTLTRQFTPDTTNCRYNQVLTQPNTGYAVSEAFTYDSFGNVSTDVLTGTGMTARTTTANWGTTGQMPMSVTDASGATTQYNYNFSVGLPSSTTDPNGETTSWLYDGFGRKTQETRPDGTYTVFSYEDCVNWDGCPISSHSLALEHRILNTDGSVESVGSTWFDPLQRPVLDNEPSLTGSYNRYEVGYDSLGRIVRRAAPCAFTAVATPCPYMTTTSYDVLNRVASVSRPISASNSTLETTTYAYAGRTTVVTDPKSNVTTAIQDVNGWLRQTSDPYGYSVTTAYDAAGNRTGVTDSSGNTLWSGTYAYGVSPFLVTATDMDLGAWSYTVDALGERTAWQDAKGQSFSETYDVLSRPLTRTEPDQFTQWTWGTSASSHNIGKPQSVCMGPAPASGSAGACTSSYYSESESYDSVGRLSQRAIAIPSTGTFTYAWQYNATTGLLNTLTYPASTSGGPLQLQYEYQNGFPLSVAAVISGSPNVTVWQANATNAAGQLTQETLGNGIVTNRAFDAVTGWLSSIQSGVGGGTGVQNQSFLYDFVGDVIQRQDNNLGLTENIYYDNDYRLSSTDLGSTQNLAITYDLTGNITSRSDVASGATWTYDPVRKHAVTQAGSSAYNYSYDANGNAITRQGSSILWSSYNYPTSISAGSGSTAETVAFSYGPDRQRWQQAYSGNSTTETTQYVGRELEVVSSGGVTDYRHYIYAGGRAVAVYSRKSTGTNTFSYLSSDHQGSVASITNSSGTSVVNESFTPFGSRRNPATWSGAPLAGDLTTSAGITREGYTFQTQLGLWMGLNHMNGRVQDSITGRFLSPDPRIQNRADTQSYNRYSYVNNNPVSFTDPTGFDEMGGNGGDDGGGGDSGGGDFGGGGSTGVPDAPGVSDPGAPGSSNSGSVGGQQSGGTQANQGTPLVVPCGDQCTVNISASSDSLFGAFLLGNSLVGGSTGSQPPVLKNPTNIPQQGNQNQDMPEVTVRATPCPTHSSSFTWSNYLSNVTQNFITTNTALPYLAKKGVGALTSGAMSEALYGNAGAGALGWAARGFPAIQVYSLTLSRGVSVVAVGVSTAANSIYSGLSFEAGVGLGAVVGAVPVGGGNTISGSLTDFLYNQFGPSSSASELTCGW